MGGVVATSVQSMDHCLWIEGLLRRPRLEIVLRGSCPRIRDGGLISRKASMTALARLDRVNDKATVRGISSLKDCLELTSPLNN